MTFLPSLSPGNVKGTLPSDWKYDNDTTWTRPTEWLDLNVPSGTPEKIIGLLAVFPNDEGESYFAWHIDTDNSSSYTIDWGDGTTIVYSSNTTYYKVYDYDAITTDTSTQKATLFRGYKQAVFTINIVGSAKFSQIQLDVDGPYSGYTSAAYRTGPRILDLFVSSSNCTDIELNDARPMAMVEQIEIRNTSSNRLTKPEKLYRGCRRLESIPFVPWIYNSGTRDYLYAFWYCHNLKKLPDEFASTDKYWFKNPSRLQQTFEKCYSLRYLPNGLFGTTELSSCSNYYYMFGDCRSLENIPDLPVRTGSQSDTRLDFVFLNCLKLRAIPQGFSLERANSNGIDRLFAGNLSNKDFSAVDDGTTPILETINYLNNGNKFNMSQLFQNNDQLREVPYIGQFSQANGEFYNVFGASHNITHFNSQYTHLDLSSATSLKQLFQDCYSLEEIPEIRIRSLTLDNALYYTFYFCFSLRKVVFRGMINLGGNREYYRMFYHCHSLEVIDGIDWSYANDAGDYYQALHVARNVHTIKFPGVLREGATRINVSYNNDASHSFSGEYQIASNLVDYEQVGGNASFTRSGTGPYTWTFNNGSGGTTTIGNLSATAFPWTISWQPGGYGTPIGFSDVQTGFKYTITGGSGDGLRYKPIKREQMLEIFNQLVDISGSHSATIDIRNNSYTSDLTDTDKAIATNKGWTISL